MVRGDSHVLILTGHVVSDRTTSGSHVLNLTGHADTVSDRTTSGSHLLILTGHVDTVSRHIVSNLDLVPSRKLQALVYNILPSTTAVFSDAIGSRKLSANEQFFVLFLLVLKQ